MTNITIINCRACRLQYGDPIVLEDRLPLRGELEAVRAEARLEGWHVLRPSGQDSYGDYCPQCSRVLRQKAAERKAAK